jgi:hypothetical protein
MKNIFIIFISLAFSFPPSFNLDREPEIINNGLPSNSIIDIEAISGTQIYFGTSSGLGRIDVDGEDRISSKVVSDAMPEGGNPALVVKGDIIAVSGVTTYYSAVTESNEPKGMGVAYSVDLGNTWKFIEQPIVENPEDGLYHQIEWGGQTLKILAVTTAVNNVSYDLAIGGDYIYSTSWAGGLRRFNFTDDNPSWEIIPLPMDNQSELICGDIDTDVYELNPKDPGDGGNHNHKGFSVFIDNENIFVGTADGINKGVIVEGCISWSHYSTADGLSGNWIVGVNSGLNSLWAISWSTTSTESTGLSYSLDDGISWQYVNFFTDAGIKVYNIEISGDRICASTIQGLYISEDGEHWELISSKYFDNESGQEIYTDPVYSTYLNESLNQAWIGTGDGLVIYDFITNNDEIVQSYNKSNFSAFPNPFFISQDGNVRFYKEIEMGISTEINIFDFSMDHVVRLVNGFTSVNTRGWDGRNSRGKLVANGVYFCKLTANNKDYWTKLVVMN